MAEVKEIRLRFVADDSQAAPKLKATADAVNQVGSNMQRAVPQIASGNNALFATTQIARDLPFGFIAISNNLPILADQFTALRASAGSTTLALKSMWTAMMGPAGIALAISAVISAITWWSLSNRGAKKETDENTASIDKQKQAFDSLKSSIDSASKARLADLATALQIEKVNLRAEIARGGKESPEQTARLKEIEESLRLAKEEFATMGILGEQRRKIAELQEQANNAQTEFELTSINRQTQLAEAELKRLQNLGKVNEEIKKSTRYIKEQIEALGLMGLIRTRGASSGRMEGVENTGKYGIAGLDPERLKVDFSFLEDLTMSWASVLRSEGMQAFEDIFGEANSLLEKLIQATIAEFMNLGAKQLAGYLFNLALPGAGSIFTALFGRSGTNTTVINLDGKVLGEFVQGEVPYAMARANTLRIA